MNAPFTAVVEECTAASDASRMSFPEVVGKLMSAGVERYHADLVRAEKTYFRPDGTSHVVANDAIGCTPAAEFAGSAVAAAVKAAQNGEIDYKTFCARVIEAGCVGYHVHIGGRRVIYYGRSGDSHTEHFPGAR